MSWTALIERFWPSTVWGVVLAMGIYIGSQRSLPATTRSQLGPHQLALLQLVLHNLMPCLWGPRHLGPSFRTLLAQSWVTGTVSWRYVGSSCQAREECLGQRVGQLEARPEVSVCGRPVCFW